MGFDESAQIEFFQARGVKAGQQHVVHEEEVCFAGFEVFDPLVALVFGADVVQYQGGGELVVRGRLKIGVHLPRLLCAVADNHGAEAVVLVGFAEFGKVVKDVVEHRADEMRMGVDGFALYAAFFDFKLRQCCLQLGFVLAVDGFADEAQGVAVGDGGVVIIFVDVVAEEFAGVDAAGGYSDKRRAGQPDFDGVYVGLVEVGKKRTFGVVAAVYFVEEIDALDAQVVVAFGDDVGVVFEFLDVDDGDFRFAGMVVQGLGGFDVGGEGFAAVDGVDDEVTGGEFLLRLFQEVEPVHDEIEFWHDTLFGVIAG